MVTVDGGFVGVDLFLVLPDMDVDVVLAVGLSRSDEYWADLLEGRDGPGDETLEELQLRTTEESAKTLTEAGPDLVIAKSMFGTDGYGLEGPHPLSCLAEAKTLAACAVAPPTHRPVVDAVYDTLAIRMDAVHTADFTEAICPDRPVCRPVLGKTVVWKDPDHVTTRVLRERRKVIWQQLKATGLFD